jgi:hypothetical protein
MHLAGCGVVFRLARTDSGWQETVLHNFRGGKSGGANPQQALTLDGQGNIYGVAFSIVFEITQ